MWSQSFKFDTASVNTNASPNIGVYEVDDMLMETVYYGEGNIRERLLYHLQNREFPKGYWFRFEETNSKQRAVQRQNALLEEYKRRHGKYPMYNERKG